MGRPYGQHFLRDPRVLQDILSAAAIQSGERVLEIGPGRGVLTAPLAHAVGPTGRVVAVEADASMAGPLQGRWGNVQVSQADAVRADLQASGPFDAIVANLPYQISGPVTAKLLTLLREQGWGRAVLMFQKEFAQRLLAGPGSKAYGKLSVQTARLCRMEKVRDVPPGCFDPPPRVHSMVLRFTPREQALFTVDDEQRLQAILDRAFSQRRKQLHNSLAGLVAPERLEALGVATLRPEQVPPQTFGKMV